MLVLSRKLNESIVIDGQITVKILKIEGDQVRLGIQAPVTVPIHRQEVYEEIQRTNREALNGVRPKLPRLSGKPSPIVSTEIQSQTDAPSSAQAVSH